MKISLKLPKYSARRKLICQNSSTAYTIVARRDQAVQSHGGKRYQKFDDEMKEKAVDVLSGNPLITPHMELCIMRYTMGA